MSTFLCCYSSRRLKMGKIPCGEVFCQFISSVIFLSSSLYAFLCSAFFVHIVLSCLALLKPSCLDTCLNKQISTLKALNNEAINTIPNKKKNITHELSLFVLVRRGDVNEKKVCWRKKDIQHQGFAGRHRPNY